MKKIRIMVLALIVAVAMTGAGYAAWSTTITFNNTVKSADWNVFIENDVTDGSQYDSLNAEDEVSSFNPTTYATTGTSIDSEQNRQAYDEVLASDASGATKVNGTNYVYTIAPVISTNIEDDDTVDFQFYNMHPGTRAKTRFEIRNLGTIPAKISDIRVTVTDAQGNTVDSNYSADPDVKALYDAMIVTGNFYDHFVRDTNNDGTNENADNLIGAVSNKHLSDLQDALKAQLVGDVLYENHVITQKNSQVWPNSSEAEAHSLVFTVPADSLKGTNHNNKTGNVGMDSQLKIKVEFDFVQYNQDITGKTTTLTYKP